MSPPYLASSCEPDRRPCSCAKPCWTTGRSQLGHPPLAVAASDAYRRELAAAATATGLDESVLTGEGTVFGRRVALVACEFDFLAGSIGVAAAERITAAVERATARGPAAVGVAELRRHPHAGGHRRVPADGQDRRGRGAAQAGAPAVSRLPAPSHDRRGVRHLGLAGPRHRGRARRTRRIPRPAGLRAPLRRAVPGGHPDRGEPAAARRHRRRGSARRAALDAGSHAEGGRRPTRTAATGAAVRAAARRARVGIGGGVASPGPARRRVSAAARHDASGCCCRAPAGARRATTVLALARFGGQPAVVLGQQRVVGGMVGPAALREARRGMALAAGLQLPLVLFIDTAGPALSAEAEQGGLAGEIARCLAELVTLDTPTVSVLLGSGQRRTGAGDGACRPGAGRAARMAGPATAGRGQRDRVPRRRPCPGTRCGAGHSVGGPVAPRHRRRDRARTSRRGRRADGVHPAAVGDRSPTNCTGCVRFPTISGWTHG